MASSHQDLGTRVSALVGVTPQNLENDGTLQNLKHLSCRTQDHLNFIDSRDPQLRVLQHI